MPTWDKVSQEFDTLQISYLSNSVKELYKITNRTTICYLTAFQTVKPPVPQPFHSIIDADMQGFMTCSKDVDKNNLDLLLHTPGGSLEATKSIISYLRQIYKHIRVIVPIKAMSGGTLIACAADEILMGPYSHLGPTSPQIFLKDSFVPVKAIINEFRLAFEEVKNNPQSATLWRDRLKDVPFGMYQSIKNMDENAEKDLKNLLKSYMLKNDPDKEIKAKEITKYLNSPEAHTSHGHGINIEMIKDKGLNVKNLHDDETEEDLVLTIYHICSRLFETTPVQKIIINHNNAKYISSYRAS